MLTKREERQFIFLTERLYIMPSNICQNSNGKWEFKHYRKEVMTEKLNELLSIPEVWNKESAINHYKDRLFLLSLYEKQGYTDESEILMDWYTRYSKRSNDKYFYKSMPTPDRRDNKHTRVGSGGGGYNSIRYPKKIRKTAWKRFYKLFPGLDPKNKKEEQ